MIPRLRIGILPKLFVAMMVVTLIPLGTIWYLDYRASAQQLSRAVDERLGLQADNAVAYVESWLETNLRLLRQNARLDAVTSMDASRAGSVLRALAKEYPWVFLAHLTGPDGMNIARSDDAPLISYADRSYFTQAMNGAPFGSQVAIGKTSGKPALMMAVAVSRRDAVVGALTIAQHIDAVTARIANVRLGRTGYAFLVNASGDVVAHPHARMNLANHPAVKAVQSGDARKRVEFTEGDRRILAYAQRTQHGWVVVVQQDEAEAFAPLQDAHRMALVMLAGSVLFVGLLSGLLAPQLTGPIRNLTEIAESISRGQLGMEIEEVDRTDEIGALARTIDRLKASVEVAMKRLTADQRPGRPAPAATPPAVRAAAPVPATVSSSNGARDE